MSDTLVVANQWSLYCMTGPVQLASFTRAPQSNFLEALRGTASRVAVEWATVPTFQLLAAAIFATLECCAIPFRATRPLMTRHEHWVQATMALHLDILAAWGTLFRVAGLGTRVVTSSRTYPLTAFLTGTAVLAGPNIIRGVFHDVALNRTPVVSTGKHPATAQPTGVMPQL